MFFPALSLPRLALKHLLVFTDHIFPMPGSPARKLLPHTALKQDWLHDFTSQPLQKSTGEKPHPTAVMSCDKQSKSSAAKQRGNLRAAGLAVGFLPQQRQPTWKAAPGSLPCPRAAPGQGDKRPRGRTSCGTRAREPTSLRCEHTSGVSPRLCFPLAAAMGEINVNIHILTLFPARIPSGTTSSSPVSKTLFLSRLSAREEGQVWRRCCSHGAICSVGAGHASASSRRAPGPLLPPAQGAKRTSCSRSLEREPDGGGQRLAWALRSCSQVLSGESEEGRVARERPHLDTWDSSPA